MLPLVQMHRVVQPSSPRDSSPPLEHYRLQHQARHPRSADLMPARDTQYNAFPIRTSHLSKHVSTHPRPGGFALPSHLVEHHEHHLRRKTPNGTIDAGYDGTPLQLASGPPPLKHMILPASSNLATAVPSSPHSFRPKKHPLRSASGSWTYPSSAPSSFISREHPIFPDPSHLAFGGALQAGLINNLCPVVAPDGDVNGKSGVFQSYNNGVRIPTVLQPLYQHAPGPAVFHNGGLLPTPALPEINALHYHHRPLGAPTYNSTTRPLMMHSPSLETFMPPGVPFTSNAMYEPSVGNFQAPSQRLESLTLGPVRYDSTVLHFQDASSLKGFREKALTHAHISYIDLLAYLHHSKKSQVRASGNRSSSKMVIFPKLPKQLSQNSISNNLQSVVTGPHGYLGRRADSYGTHSRLAGLGDLQAHSAAGPQARINDASRSAYHHSVGFAGPRPVSVDVTAKLQRGPLHNAKAAADVLTHLCEQSGWKWVEGMLLGGCLFYGLEQYEQSLEWFRRILSLDESHVEALSNIAATLYCLNRHEEAENHWLRAVQKQPSYLEAAEHLVNLLCTTHRSKEAVDIIDFVQRSIRLHSNHLSVSSNVDASSNAGCSTSELDVSCSTPRSTLLNDCNHLADLGLPGIGSSGYSVPGSENGRVIALIHAKGNMLYALKDIDRAAEAFEEAVLIGAGKTLKSIHSLIRRIQVVLSPVDAHELPNSSDSQQLLQGPLLLPPEKARHTAQLVFGAHGGLPGLRYVPDGVPRKSAVSTTSNSLLSLAKIFQDAMSNGCSYPRLMHQPSGVGDILALYYLSLSLSESPSTANNVGILLASVQQASPIAPSNVPEQPNTRQIPGIVPGSGLSLALAYYNYGLSLDPKHVHLHTNLGSLLKDIGQLDLAIQMYEQAVACDGTFDIALTNLANAVKDRGRVSDAIMYYKRAVSSNPQFAEAVCGLSTALNSVCDWRGRGGVLLGDGRYDRWHVDDNGMLTDARDQDGGSGLMRRVVDIVSKQLSESAYWGSGILRSEVSTSILPQLKGTVPDAVGLAFDVEREIKTWAGRSWEGSRLLRLIERSTKVAMRRWYQDEHVQGRQSRNGYSRPRLPTSLAIPAAPTVLPFHTFTCPLTAKDIRMISQRNAARISCSALKSPWLPDLVYPPPPPPNPQLNVGYVSSDFNNHPLAHLMQSVFGFHDSKRAKAYCYATTVSDKSVHRQQIEREAPVFRDVSSWPAERLVDQIVKDRIHILVNLNGYTRGARNEVFAARPAPIQMSFMGFAGTLGAEWCDYILADETAIPPSTLRPFRNNMSLEDVFQDEEFGGGEDWIYSENIVFCRDTFFCCDHAQSSDADERSITWRDEQRRRWQMRRELFPSLPNNTIILGNFNQLYKIDPSTFRTWLRILSNVPKAILWLLRFPELGESNLKRTARAWAGDDVASRIFFTDVAPKQQHIARARVCDLFLDTPECNAHTTAADVLWSSTPLLTLPRYPYKMCSRIAASILKGALPRSPDGDGIAQELIASDDDDYEALASRLAGGLTYHAVDSEYCEGRGRLVEMRKILFESKWTCPLFDTHRWVADLEDAYEEAWRRWVAGEGGDIYL